MSKAVEEIVAERERQKSKGYDNSHDDRHQADQLVWFARELLGSMELEDAPSWCPDSVDHVMEKYANQPRRVLVIAAALLVAELDRQDRFQAEYDAASGRGKGLSPKLVELRSAYEWTCEECGRDNFSRALPWELMPEDLAAMEENSDAMKNVIRKQFDDAENPGRFNVSACKSPEHVTCQHCGVSFKVQTSRDEE